MSADPPLKVLIVEDEVLLAVELEYMITSCGARAVGHAMTSPEAIALAEQLQPDLALVDVHLSDGPTGIDAARQMIDHCGAVVLFITANVKRLPDDYAGACGAMSKPYTEHGVRTALAFLDDCLRQGRATRPPPPGLTLAPSFASSWSVDQAA